METLKHPACTVGRVARFCRRWLSPGKLTRVSDSRNPNGTIQVLKKAAVCPKISATDFPGEFPPPLPPSPSPPARVICGRRAIITFKKSSVKVVSIPRTMVVRSMTWFIVCKCTTTTTFTTTNDYNIDEADDSVTLRIQVVFLSLLRLIRYTRLNQTMRFFIFIII